MHSPQEHHWKAVKRILRYLKGTLDYGLLIKHNTNNTIQGFCDSDWASDIDDRKSTTGYCMYFGSNLVSWSSHKQNVVSRRNTKAEYHGIVVVLADIIWLQSLLNELHISCTMPKIYSNNLGAVLLSANRVMHSRSKHFDIDIHFVYDHVQRKHVSLIHIPARFQLAGVFTKPIFGPSFTFVRPKLMVLEKPIISLRDVKQIT